MEVGGDSYFPSTSTAQHDGNSTNTGTAATMSSTSPSAISSSSGTTRPAPMKQTSSGIGPYPLSALDRHHAPPDDELDLEAQLAKPPLPRSLHSSLRAAAVADRKAKMAAADDAETRAQRLAEAKKEWASWAAN